MAEPTLHIGRKISKIRELKGMKQETLASELGISQQAVSKIEQSADVDGEALEKLLRFWDCLLKRLKPLQKKPSSTLFQIPFIIPVAIIRL